jgi:hypothetical protein
MGSGREVSKNTSLIWQISFNGQRCDLQIHHCFLNYRSIACSWYITNRKKAAFAIVLFPIQNIPNEGHYLSKKKVGSALTETENWDLLVDCTSRDGRKMLDAGVHLSDKRTLLMKTHRPFQTQYKLFYRIRFCFNKWWRNNRFYYFWNAFKFILPCLRPLECNEKNQIRFLMKGEKFFIKKIFLLSVYKENRAVFPFRRKFWWQSSKIFQKVNYVTCSLVLWKYTFGVICTKKLQIQKKNILK